MGLPCASVREVVMAGSSTVFSKVESRERLAAVFGGKRFTITPAVGKLPSVGLVGRVFANEDEAAIVRRAYGDFFLRDSMDVAVRDVPHSLRHIFHLLCFVKSCKYKLFSNGAGKHFLSALLGNFEFGKDWCAIHSTTNDPRSDWCGIKAGGGVSGVADVVLQNMSSDRLVVGEVKLTPEGGRESIPGENQLIAELKAVQQRQARQSIVGLLMNPTTIYIYLPRSTRKGTFKFELVKKDVRDFDEVLAALDIVFGFLVEVGTPSRPSTPEGGEIRQEIASLRLMVRQGQGASEELRDAVATLTTQVKTLTLQVNRLTMRQD